MEAETSRRRALAAFLLFSCVIFLLGLAAVGRPSAGRAGRDSPWLLALRNALNGVSSGPNPLGRDVSSKVAGQLLPGRPVLSPEAPPPSELGAPAAGSPRGGPAEELSAGAGDGSGAAGGPGAQGGGRALEGYHSKGREGLGPSGSGGSSFEALGGGKGDGAAGGSGLGSGAAAGASSARIKAEEVAQIFSGFIQRLRHEAALQARSSRGAGLPQGPHAAGGYNRGDASMASGIPNAQDSPLMASPSFRNLMSVGREAQFAVSLHERGMTDGTKDKAGKEFDGNTKTLAPIPIERSQGAFNQETIRARTKTPDPPPAAP